MQKYIVFDVNETLLDLAILDVPFRRIFGVDTARKDWFAQLLQLALVVTVTDTYRDFKSLAGEALGVVAQRLGFALDDATRAEILEQIGQLPAHAEVPEALDLLKESGFHLVALTNSPPATVNAQLTNAGIIDRFELVLSVDPTRRFKPHPAPYLMAANELGSNPSELWMVAAHDWDIAGAMEVGLKGAFVARPGQAFAGGYRPPDLVGTNLTDVAEKLISRL